MRCGDIRSEDLPKIEELLSVGVKRGTILLVRCAYNDSARNITTYVGPVEKIKTDALVLISGGYSLRRSIPTAKRDLDRVRIYGSEIKDYQVLVPLLAAAVPRFKRNY